MPSIRLAMRVSSASWAGSDGAGMEVPRRSSWIARAVSGVISCPSKRRDSSIHWLSRVR